MTRMQSRPRPQGQGHNPKAKATTFKAKAKADILWPQAKAKARPNIIGLWSQFISKSVHAIQACSGNDLCHFSEDTDTHAGRDCKKSTMVGGLA